MSLSYAFVRMVRCALRGFGSDRRGNVAIIFAFASIVMTMGIGAGIDLARAYSARQKLSEIATLTCQYSTRPSVLAANTGGSTGFTAYLKAVNDFATANLTSQNWVGTVPTGTNGTYFTATAPSGTATTPTNPVTEMQASLTPAFMQIAGVKALPVHAKVACQDASTTATIVTNPLVLQEGFETSCTTYCFTKADGTTGTTSTPSSSVPSSASYTGTSGAQWYILGYCLETDVAGIISATAPEGTHTAELDCDNGSGSAGNSSISTKIALAVGTYEIRYNYRERIPNATYAPAYVCGSQIDPDVDWVSNNTNQINVYLDAVTGTFPTHVTLDNSQTLGGTNLIDTCVNSLNWIERSIVVNVTTAGNFWLSFAADGTNDSYGGQIDNIRVCTGSCTGTPADNFPSGLLSSTLVSSSFLVATTTGDWGWNPYLRSLTTYISPMCPTLLFCSNPSRTASTSVMLDPGFYELTYQYLSLATFTSPPSTGCVQTPASSDISPFSSKSVTAKNSSTGLSYATRADVDIIGAFLTFPQQTLSPSVGGTTSAANPLIDSCLYSTSAVSRKIGIQVTKPGYYNLAFYAAGTSATQYLGGAIGSVTVQVLGSPYTLATSTSCPSLPVPGPQIGATVSYTGFTFTITNPFLQNSSSTSCAPT